MSQHIDKNARSDIVSGRAFYYISNLSFNASVNVAEKLICLSLANSFRYFGITSVFLTKIFSSRSRVKVVSTSIGINNEFLGTVIFLGEVAGGRESSGSSRTSK